MFWGRRTEARSDDTGGLHTGVEVYYDMLFRGKKANVAKTALARELACFIWGMMNEKFA
ncbi:MAG: hypothetical protein IKE76_09260 [Clostridia bacterium]|nr:hypothetical protein [Clostridia bacterium]